VFSRWAIVGRTRTVAVIVRVWIAEPVGFVTYPVALTDHVPDPELKVGDHLT
jgi:hypothetical protein